MLMNLIRHEMNASIFALKKGFNYDYFGWKVGRFNNVRKVAW